MIDRHRKIHQGILTLKDSLWKGYYYKLQVELFNVYNRLLIKNELEISEQINTYYTQVKDNL